jgi:hypothetical protein
MIDIRQCPKCGKEWDVSGWHIYTGDQYLCRDCDTFTNTCKWLAPQAEEPIEMGTEVWSAVSNSGPYIYIGYTYDNYHSMWCHKEMRQVLTNYVTTTNPHLQEETPEADGFTDEEEELYQKILCRLKFEGFVQREGE